MILMLGQRWLTCSSYRLRPGSREGKGFIQTLDENLLTFLASRWNVVMRRGGRNLAATLRRQSSKIVTDFIATGSSGRSRALRGAAAIWSTMSRPFVTWPKIV